MFQKEKENRGPPEVGGEEGPNMYEEEDNKDKHIFKLVTTVVQWFLVLEQVELFVELFGIN